MSLALSVSTRRLFALVLSRDLTAPLREEVAEWDKAVDMGQTSISDLEAWADDISERIQKSQCASVPGVVGVPA